MPIATLLPRPVRPVPVIDDDEKFEAMADTWFVGRAGERSGPFTAQTLRDMAASGRLAPTDLVWQEGMANWVAAAAIRGLFAEHAPGMLPTINPYAAPAADPSRVTAATGDAIGLDLASREYSFSAAVALAAHTFTSRWVKLVLLGLLVAVTIIVVGLFQALFENLQPGQSVNWMAIGASWAVAILVTGPLFAGLFVAAANTTVGRPNIADLLLGFRRYGTVVLTNLLVALIAAGVAIVGFVPLLAAAFAADAIQGWNRNPEMHPVAAILVGTCMIAIFLTAAVVGVRTGFAPALAADPENGDLNAFASLWLSWSRTSGIRGFSLLGLLLLAGIVMVLTLLLVCVGFVLLGLPIFIAVLGSAYQLLFRSGRAAARMA